MSPEPLYVDADATSGGLDDLLNTEGKTCSEEGCGHKAHAAFQWAPGHFAGFRCACCFRSMWEGTLQNVQESLAGLPEECS